MEWPSGLPMYYPSTLDTPYVVEFSLYEIANGLRLGLP